MAATRTPKVVGIESMNFSGCGGEASQKRLSTNPNAVLFIVRA
jgi:hypothetical protein